MILVRLLLRSATRLTTRFMKWKWNLMRFTEIVDLYQELEYN